MTSVAARTSFRFNLRDTRHQRIDFRFSNILPGRCKTSIVRERRRYRPPTKFTLDVFCSPQ